MNKIFINIQKIVVTSTIFFATFSSPLNAHPKVLKIGAIPDQNQEVLDKRFNLFAKELNKVIIITRGSKGSMAIDKKNIIGIANSGVTAKNLINPGACAYPTEIIIFLNGILLSLSGKIFTPIT